MFRDLTIPLSTVRVAPFANAIHSAERKMWVKWRQGVAKGSVYLDASLGEELVAGVFFFYGMYVFFMRE